MLRHGKQNQHHPLHLQYYDNLLHQINSHKVLLHDINIIIINYQNFYSTKFNNFLIIQFFTAFSISNKSVLPCIIAFLLNVKFCNENIVI